MTQIAGDSLKLFSVQRAHCVFDDLSAKPPIPVVARSKAWVCGRSLAGIVGSNAAGGMDVCLC